MAGFAVTVTSADINVTSGTGTLDGVYAVVNDSNVMAKTGVNPYVYTIKGNRRFLLNAGVTVNMSNAGDVLEWDLTATKVVLQVQKGSTFTMTQNCVLRGDSNSTNLAQFYIYGFTSFIGTSGNDVILENYYQCWFWDQPGGTPHNWNYVTLRNNTHSSAGIFMVMGSQYADARLAHSFTNLTFTDVNNRAYAMFLHGDCTAYTLDNITVDGTYDAINSNGGAFKFTNSTFKNTYNVPMILSSTQGTGHYETVNDANPNKDILHQPKITFDNCTFQNNYTSTSSERCFYIVYRAVVKFKNCSFLGANSLDPSTYGAMSYRRSRLLYEGTTTFTDVTINRYWQGGGSHFHVWPLTMTVQDEKGNVLVNALVIVRHINGNEEWFFHTNAAGQVLDLHGDDPVFVEKEETSTNVFTSWTSPGHEIIVTKPGYQVWRRSIIFNMAQTVTAELMPESSPRPLPVDFGV